MYTSAMIIDEIKKIFCIQRLDEKQRIFFLLYLNSDRNIVDLDLVRLKYVYIALINRFILKTYNPVYTIETLISSFDM